MKLKCRRYRHNHHLMGLEIDDLEKLDPSLKQFNNSIYRYPSYSDLQNNSIRGIYLSNYIPWNQTQQEQMSEHYNYLGCENETKFIYNTYEYPHCAFYNGVHDWIKYMKHGYNRTLDHLVRDLRWGRLTQADAAKYIAISKYQKPVRNIRIFREFMGMQKNSLDYLLESIKNEKHFEQNDNESKLYKGIKSFQTQDSSKKILPQSIYGKVKMSSITNQVISAHWQPIIIML